MRAGVSKPQLAVLVSIAALVSTVTAFVAELTATSFSFDVSISSSRGGVVQTFYDVGKGVTEQDSVRAPLPASEMTRLQMPLPEGTYNTLRFDPLDRADSNIVIKRVQIVDIAGRTIRELSPADFSPSNISRFETGGEEMRLGLGPNDNDSQLVVSFNPPLTLQRSPAAAPLFFGKVFLGTFIPVIAAGFAWLIFAPRLWRTLEPRAVRTAAWARQHPAGTLLLVAVMSVAASCYPVIFFGKSFVSPNNGALLLYDRLPTLPGYTSSTQDDARGADLGSEAWQHGPYAVVESRAIFHDFEIPLWNRYDSCGVALFGQGQSMLGDPLQGIVLLARGAAWAWDLKFVLAKVLFAFGMGLTILIATRHLQSAVILTASSVFIGFFFFRYNHAAIFSFCYSPWILYYWFRIREAPARSAVMPGVVGLMVACWFEINSGTVKEAYMLLAGMNTCGLLTFVLAEGPRSLKLRKSVHLLVGGGLFVALTAPVWQTFLDTLRTAYTAYNVPAAWQIQPSLFIGIFDDMFYREFLSGEGALAPSSNFLILLGVLLALAYFRVLIADPTFKAIGISALIPLSLVFGIVPQTVIVKIPFVANIIGVENIFSCVAVIHLILIGAFGLRAFWQRANAVEWKTDAFVALAFLLLLLSLYFGFVHAWEPQSAALHPHPIRTSHFFDWYVLSLLFSIIVLPLAARYALRSPTKSFLVAPILLLGLIFVHWRAGMYLKTPIDEYVMNPQVRVNLAVASPAVQRVRESQQEPSRAVGLGDNLFPGFNATLAIEGIHGPDAVRNPYFRELTEAWGMEKQWDWKFIIKAGNLGHMKPFCDFLNVRYYLGSSSENSVPGLQSVAALDLAVYESKSVWPRAFFTDMVSVYKTLPNLTRMLEAGDGRPFAAVAVSDLGDARSLTQLAAGPTADREVVAASDYRFTNNTTSFRIQAPKAGVVVLTETYLRDDFWVELNGKPAPYFRVNHAFKGVVIDKAGEYLVTFKYWPRHLTRSLCFSFLGMVGLLLYIRQNRPGRRVEPGG